MEQLPNRYNGCSCSALASFSRPKQLAAWNRGQFSFCYCVLCPPAWDSNVILWQKLYKSLNSLPDSAWDMVLTYQTNNSEIFITDIGERYIIIGGLPSLTVRTDVTTFCRSGADNNGNGPLGQWTYPAWWECDTEQWWWTRTAVLYINRNIGSQIIRLNYRVTNPQLTPTGSYCCTIPTTRRRYDPEPLC